MDSDSAETLKFYWKVSSVQRGPSTSLGTPALPRPKRTGCSARSFGLVPKGQAQDACARAPRTTRDGVLGDYLQFYIDSTLKDQPADPRGGPDRRRGGLASEVLRRHLRHSHPPRAEAVPALCRGGIPPLQRGPEARETQGQDALATGGLRAARG